jgi:hypothetical protein
MHGPGVSLLRVPRGAPGGVQVSAPALFTEYRLSTSPDRVLWQDGRKDMPVEGTILHHEGKGYLVESVAYPDDGPPVVWVREHRPRRGSL